MHLCIWTPHLDDLIHFDLNTPLVDLYGVDQILHPSFKSGHGRRYGHDTGGASRGGWDTPRDRQTPQKTPNREREERSTDKTPLCRSFLHHLSPHHTHRILTLLHTLRPLHPFLDRLCTQSAPLTLMSHHDKHHPPNMRPSATTCPFTLHTYPQSPPSEPNL